MHRIWMGVVVLSAGCSWVLPEPLPFTAENVQDAMIEDAGPPRPDFKIAPPVDQGQRFDMRRPRDRGVPIDEGIEPDMDELDEGIPFDEGFIEVDQSFVELDLGTDGEIDAMPDLTFESDMSADMSIDPPE